MAELASSMSGFLLPNNFQPLDPDSDNESEASEYGSGAKLPFSGSQGSASSNHTVDIMTCSPEGKVETVPSERVSKMDDSWNHDSGNSTSDSCYTPNTSVFTSDLGSSGGFSSVDLSLDSSNTLGQSSNCNNSFRTPCSGGQQFDESCKRALQPVTPTKPADGDVQNDPLTPTANLKMLLSAASPEIRNMENKKKKARLFEGLVEVASQGAMPPSRDASTRDNLSQLGLLNSSQEESALEDSEKANNRKSKSLGLLCQKFLTKYPDYPEDGKAMDISLDQISKDLNVERRRIYDIVNVLESVEMVSRRAKNRYLWHGRTRIHSTLAKLKCLGQRQRFAEQLAHLQRLDEGHLLSDENMSPPCGEDRMYPTLTKLPFQDLSNIHVPLKSPTEAEMRRDGQENWEDDTKKDKTLGVMSQKFIMLFLVCKDRVISLDVAARILKGDQNYQMGESAKFKTKVRRLYDIANILTSLKLIDKIHLSEGRGRKPAFRWIGPDPDTSHVDLSELPSGSKPTQKHSYFPLPPVTAEAWSSHPTHKQTSAMKKLPLGKLGAGKSRLNWSRNASFSAICEVAEQECRKYSSAPSSPVKVEKEEEGQEGVGSSPSLENSGKKKEQAFLKEFEALRNKYPSCVSRLFSARGGAPDQPTASPTSSPVDHLVHQSPTDCRVPRPAHMEVTSPITPAAQAGGGGLGKPQKVVYVQRFVPLLNANTIAAVQASTVAQSTGQTTASSTIVAGHRTTMVTNPTLVSSQSPVMLQHAPGSVNHLVPLSHGGWVQLPQTNGTMPRNIVNLQHHGNLSSAVKSSEMNGQVAVTTSPPLTTSPGVAINRRSKRQVKLALDNEFEYQPLVKKMKVDDAAASNSQAADVEPCIEEPIRKPTVVVAHQTALSSSTAPWPHPKPDTQHIGPATSATGCRDTSHEQMETLIVKSDAKHRTEALKHVKRRLTIDLENVPPVPDSLLPKKPSNKKKEKSRGKMPRCRSLPEFSGKRNLIPLESSKASETMRISSQLCEIASKYLTEAEESTALSVAREHNYSYHRVKMTFGGKLGSLEKSRESPPVQRRGEGTTSKAGAAESSEEIKRCFLEKRAVDQSMAQGVRVKNVLAWKQPACHKAEQNVQELSKNTELEDCWLSASYPPPSLSAFPTLLQGRCSTGTPHLLLSRSSSVGSIGELDQWLFPGGTESPGLAADHAIKKVTTPKGLSPDEVTPPCMSSCASPPKLTTLASPACQAVVSPQPLLPHSAQRLHEARMMNLPEGNPVFAQEPLLTSTPKDPKSQRSLTRIAESLPQSLKCQSANSSMPISSMPTPLESIGEDLVKLKAIDEDPGHRHSIKTLLPPSPSREQQSPIPTEVYNESPSPSSNPLIIDEDFGPPISPFPMKQDSMPCENTCVPNQTCRFQQLSTLGHHQANTSGRLGNVGQDGLQSVQRFPDCIPVFQVGTRGNVKSRPVDRIEKNALPQSKNILPLLPLAFNFPGQVMQRVRNECVQITARVTNVSASPISDSQVASANTTKRCNAQHKPYLPPVTFWAPPGHTPSREVGGVFQSLDKFNPQHGSSNCLQTAGSTQVQQMIMSEGYQAFGSGSRQGLHFYPSSRGLGDPNPGFSGTLQSCPVLTQVTSQRTAAPCVAHPQTSVALPASSLPSKQSSVTIDTMLLHKAKQGCAFIPVIQTLLPSPSTTACVADKYI